MTLTGPAQFVANSAQSIVVIDNAAGDTNNVADTIAVAVRGTAAGTVIVTGTDSDGTFASTAFTVETAPVVGIFTLNSPSSLSLGGNATATATVQTAGGANIQGASVTFQTSTGGSVYRSSGTTCSATATGTLATNCTATTNASGQATAVVQSTGAGGTFTLTATSGGSSDSDTIAVVGTANQLEITAVATPNVGPGGETTISATVRDAEGTGVPGVNVNFNAPAGYTLVASNGTCPGTQTQSATTNSSGVATVKVCVPSTATAGTARTITATATVGGTTLSDTETVTVAGIPTQVVVEPDDTTIPAGGTTEVTFRVLAAGDALAAADTTLTAVAAAGVLVGCNNVAIGSDGEVTCTFVAPGTPQTVTLSGVATRGTTTVSGTASVQVGGAAPGEGGEIQPPAGGQFPTSGTISLQWTGGSIDELGAELQSIGAVSTFVTTVENGRAVQNRYVVNGGFLNNRFEAKFGGQTPEVPAQPIIVIFGG